MLARPPMLRSLAFADASSVCNRCLRHLSRSPAAAAAAAARPFSTRSHREAAAVGPGRSTFTKDYFWTNGTLRETFGRTTRGLRNGSPRARETVTTATAVLSPADGRSPGDTLPEIAQSISKELPHRRRKRLREEALRKDDTGSETAEANYPIAPDASSRLTTASSNLPANSIRRLLTTYLSLAKPRLSFLIVLTTTTAYSLYPVPAILSPAMMDAPSLSTLTLLFLTSGTALCCSSANALNMLFEPKHDAKMSRTRNRPLVRKLISPTGAWLFAIGCGTAGVVALYYGVNPTTAFLGALNIALYAGVYTPMKRISVLNTWVGALVGGIPPLMGWTAAAGQCAHEGTWQELLFGNGSAGGWLLAGLLFAWQFPHFNSLSWAIRDEYKHAGYRMLAWANPARNGRVALRYAVLMFPVCFGLAYVGVTNWGFVVTSSAVNGWMVYKAVQFWREQGHKGTARGLFWASVWHLPIVMVLAMAQKKGLWERIWRAVMGQSGEELLLYEDEKDEEFEDEPEVGAAVVRREGLTA